MTDYTKIFKDSLDKLKNDGNYRIFADLEKIAGNFPQALNYLENSVSEVTVWCSNDYLGMSQNQLVIDSMIDAVNKVGAGQAGALSIVISSIATSPLPEPPPDGFCPRKRSWMLSPGDAADNGTLT